MTYTVTMPGAAFVDKVSSSPNAASALTGTTYQFTITIKLRLIFNQNIQLGTGFFRIFTSNSKIYTDIAITDNTRVSFTSNQMTILPVDVPGDTEYYISMGKNVLQDSNLIPQGFAGTVFHYTYASGDHNLEFHY